MNVLRSLSEQVAAVVARTRPGVLHLRTIVGGRQGGSGSAFVCGPDGLALTNHHVIAGADAVEATTADGRSLVADVLGADPMVDLALLRLPRDHGLPALELGDSTALRVGDFVLAVGCPHGLSHSVTAGIVSGLGRSLGGRGGRTIEDVIQTDAPFNPGNSGGPLLDADGRAVGIATAIAMPAQGLCFAVPVHTATAVVPELLHNGRVVRGWLGIGLDGVELTAAQAQRHGLTAVRALAVRLVQAGSPAAAAGLRPGDILLRLDGKPVAATGDLYRILDRSCIGRTLPLTVLRGDGQLELTVVPAQLPAAA